MTYDKTFGEHHFNILAGQEAYSYRYDVLQAARSNMAVPDMPELAVGSLVTARLRAYRIDYSLLGYLINANMTTGASISSPLPTAATVPRVSHRVHAGAISGRWELRGA